MNTLSKEITRQFYEWEQCGRGWFLFDDPVQLESPFEPFYYHRPTTYVDEGKTDSLIVSLVKSLFGKKQEPTPVSDYFPAYFLPYEFQNEDLLSLLIVTLPKDSKVRNVEMEQLLVMLSFCSAPVSFEIIATSSTLTFQFVCRDSDKVYLNNQIKAYFPFSQIKEHTSESDQLIGTGKFAAVIDFGLGEEFMRPIATVDRVDIDPFTSLFAILNSIDNGDQVAMQVLFSGTLNAWSKIMVNAVSDYKGGSFFIDAPEMLSLAKEKAKHPLFSVVIRTICQSDSIEKAQHILQQLQTIIMSMSRSNCNGLIPLGHPQYNFDRRITDMKLRQSRRLGMIMNSKELGIFVHFPNPSIISSKFKTHNRKIISAPPITQNDGLLIGVNEHNGISQEIRLTAAQRLKHTHIIGATGTGKSSLLLNIISQDLRQGNGICVLDPHGDLIDSVLKIIPDKRINDVILIDPSDSEYPIAFNILDAHSDIEKEVLSSDLVAVFRRLSSSWGDQMNSVFANAILAFLESNIKGSLADLRRFLIEKTFREEFLKNIRDSSIKYYWQKEYPLLKTNSIGPILTRLDTFLRPRLIRNMVCQQKGINFSDVLNHRRILLVKLSQGLIGNENSYLLGSFVVAKIHQATLARQSQNIRTDFFFYIDEFHHFITPSMASILSGARKYHTGLILAHQDMEQLQKGDRDIASSIIANAGIRICFRVGDNDAKKLAEGFAHFETGDLQNLNTGEAIGRVERPDFDFSFTTVQLEDLENSDEKVKELIHASQRKYCTPRDSVESTLEQGLNEYFREHFKKPNESTPVEIKQNKFVHLPTRVKSDFNTKKEAEVIETFEKRNVETQHRYLQNLIKRMAEARGYKATLEVSTPDGTGKVDVLLEKENKTIACEVSVTTDASWELHNIEKCLNAGYDTIVTCMTDKKTMQQFQKRVAEQLTKGQLLKVKVFEPEGLCSYLDETIVGDMVSETTIKGYRVKVSYDSVSEKEMKSKRESVAKIVADSLKKIKR